jgi:hypothetical protein
VSTASSFPSRWAAAPLCSPRISQDLRPSDREENVNITPGGCAESLIYWEGADGLSASSFPWRWDSVPLYTPVNPTTPLSQPGGALPHLLRRQRWAPMGAPGKLLGKRGREGRGDHLALYNARFAHGLGFFFLTYFICFLGLWAWFSTLVFNRPWVFSL